MRVPLSRVDIAPKHLQMISAVLAERLPDTEVWAYGSRVTGCSWRYSDLDLVAVGNQAICATLKEDVLDELSETLVPYIVDLKDWHTIPKHWRDEILRCYAVIHSPTQSPQTQAPAAAIQSS